MMWGAMLVCIFWTLMILNLIAQRASALHMPTQESSNRILAVHGYAGRDVPAERLLRPSLTFVRPLRVVIDLRRPTVRLRYPARLAVHGSTDTPTSAAFAYPNRHNLTNRSSGHSPLAGSTAWLVDGPNKMSQRAERLGVEGNDRGSVAAMDDGEEYLVIASAVVGGNWVTHKLCNRDSLIVHTHAHSQRWFARRSKSRQITSGYGMGYVLSTPRFARMTRGAA